MLAQGKTERSLIERVKKGPICAALIDPEDFSPEEARRTATEAAACGVGAILVGGSTVSGRDQLDDVVRAIKSSVTLPVILFPGNVTGVSHHADAILFSSLLNSSNPYFIIGAQALGASEVHRSNLESIPMGYMVFGEGSATSFVGQVNPFPTSKPNLAVIYALAAQYLGMRTLYLEAGSGTTEPIPSETIKMVRKFYKGLLFVGGGIVNGEEAKRISKAGADILVIGNLLQSKGYRAKLRQIVDATRR